MILLLILMLNIKKPLKIMKIGVGQLITLLLHTLLDLMTQKLEIKLENGLMLNLHHQTEDMLNGITLLMGNYTTGIKLKLKWLSLKNN
jgi:hypothetical protein